MCCPYVGVLLVCFWYVCVLLVSYGCAVGMLVCCRCVIGMLLVFWCVVDVLLRCVFGFFLVFGVMYNCQNALSHFWGHLQVPQCVVAIIQHPERVVAEHLFNNTFCAFLGTQNA